MPRRSPDTSPSSDSAADRLQLVVNDFADNVRVLVDIADQLREDLSWLTRNGMPHQPLTVIVHRMPAVNTTESNAGSFEFSFVSPPNCDPTAETLSDDQLRSAVIDEVVQRLAEPIGQLAQEQLNTLLSVVDHAHREVLQAIRNPPKVEGNEPPAAKSRRRRKQQPSITASITEPPSAPVTLEPPLPPPPPGRLF